jgi:oxidase EvaA
MSWNRLSRRGGGRIRAETTHLLISSLLDALRRDLRSATRMLADARGGVRGSHGYRTRRVVPARAVGLRCRTGAYITERIRLMSLALNQWLHETRAACDMHVEEIPWTRSREWVFDGRRLHHIHSAFFAVVGATVHIKGERQHHLDQPLIDQPEIGILGFLVRRAGDRTDLLIQAKPEPGNIGLLQAAPTVQATESNYRRRHQGKPTPFLEYFLSGKGTILSDSLQSEQGTRFLGKYNRNMVVGVPHDALLPEMPAFRWFPIQELLLLLLQDFQFNTDARSVLASCPWTFLSAERPPFSRWRGRGGPGEAFLHSYEAHEERFAVATPRILERLNGLRSTAHFVTSVIHLTDLVAWEISDLAIRCVDRETFSIRQFAVTTTEREVAHWDQPLAASLVQAQVVLLCQERAGLLHFLFSARPEIGFRERFQYGPTIQDLDGNSTILPVSEDQEAALRDALSRSTTLFSCLHSDEGGRFFRCVSSYGIALLPSAHPIDVGDNLCWMTLRQVELLISRPGVFSNEARSLISMVLGYV